MKNLLDWFLTNKKPGFYDCESGTAIEQTARVYKAMQELITEYNSWVEKSNKIMADFTASETEGREVFEIALRQEFQDFINVVDLKTLELEKFFKTNLNASVRALWDEMTEKGEIQEAFLTTLEVITTKANELTASNEQFKADVNAIIENQNTANEQFKNGIDTRLLNDREIMQDWVNEESEPAKHLLIKDKVLFNGEMDYLGSPVEITRDILKYSVCMVQAEDYACLCSVNKWANSCTLFGFGLMSEASAESIEFGVVNIYIGDVIDTLPDGTKETKFKIIYNKSSCWNLTDGGVSSWDGIPLFKITGIY